MATRHPGKRFILTGCAAMFLAGVLSPASFAQSLSYADAIDRLARACGKDIEKNCKSVNLGNGAIRRCLDRNQAKISATCRETIPVVFALVEKRAIAQASVVRLCDIDARRLCPGVQPGDGNLLDCALKAAKALSPTCSQALTDAGWR